MPIPTTPKRSGGPTPYALADFATAPTAAASRGRHATNARPGNAAAPRWLTARRTGPLLRAAVAPQTMRESELSWMPVPPIDSDVVVDERLGGLLRSYRRVA